MELKNWVLREVIGGGTLDWERADEIASEYDCVEDVISEIKKAVEAGAETIDPVAIAIDTAFKRFLEENLKEYYDVILENYTLYGNYIDSSIEVDGEKLLNALLEKDETLKNNPEKIEEIFDKLSEFEYAHIYNEPDFDLSVSNSNKRKKRRR